MQVPTRSTSPDMTTVFYARLDGRFIKIQNNLRRKKLHKTNQGSNFLGGSFSNRDNVRASTQFRRESQLQHPRRWYFLKNRPIHSHINGTSVICTSRNWRLSQSELLSKNSGPFLKISFFRCFFHIFYSKCITWFLHRKISKWGGFFWFKYIS